MCSRIRKPTNSRHGPTIAAALLLAATATAQALATVVCLWLLIEGTANHHPWKLVAAVLLAAALCQHFVHRLPWSRP